MATLASSWAHPGPSYSLFGASDTASDDGSIARQESWMTLSGSSSPADSPLVVGTAATPFAPATPSPAAHRQCAKQVNMRLMHAHSPSDIFGIVGDSLEYCDSINLTAAFQRLAKFLTAHPRDRGSVLSSPVFAALAGMMVEQCYAGAFNPQSTSNAWWAVSKLYGGEAPAPPALLTALEAALGACLASPVESTRPNAQAVSSTWYAWGRMGSYLPGPCVRDALWDRTYQLALNFDSQGVANMVWSWGQLRRRHDDAFAVRTDVLAALTLLVSRMPGAFAVQGLSCSAMGCANLGPTLRSAAAPLMRVLVREATARASTFNLQAMANTASALARMGGDLAGDGEALGMLRAFDARASRLPGHQKPAELAALAGAMARYGLEPHAPCLAAVVPNNAAAVQRSWSPGAEAWAQRCAGHPVMTLPGSSLTAASHHAAAGARATRLEECLAAAVFMPAAASHQQQQQQVMRRADDYYWAESGAASQQQQQHLSSLWATPASFHTPAATSNLRSDSAAYLAPHSGPITSSPWSGTQHTPLAQPDPWVPAGCSAGPRAPSPAQQTHAEHNLFSGLRICTASAQLAVW